VDAATGSVAADSLAESLANDVRHDVEQNAAGFAGVVNGNDVRVSEARRRLDLLKKPFGPEGSSDFGVQDFYRDVAAVPRIERAIDSGHPASADLMLDRIAVAKCGLGG